MLYYSDEFITLYHGDCTERRGWLSADALVTDPPYGIDYKSGQMGGSTSDTVVGDEDTSSRDSVLDLWGDRPAMVFGSWRIERPERTRQRLIWYKRSRLPGFTSAPWFAAEEEIYIIGSGWVQRPNENPDPQRKNGSSTVAWPNVIITDERRDGAAGLVARTGHPTPKPGALMEQLLLWCPPEWVIADPFAGSGATLVAARNLGRRAIGVEIEERYCELIANRLSQDVLPL